MADCTKFYVCLPKSLVRVKAYVHVVYVLTELCYAVCNHLKRYSFLPVNKSGAGSPPIKMSLLWSKYRFSEIIFNCDVTRCHQLYYDTLWKMITSAKFYVCAPAYFSRVKSWVAQIQYNFALQYRNLIF